MAEADVSCAVTELLDVTWDAACGGNCRDDSLGALDWMESIACDSSEERGGEP